MEPSALDVNPCTLAASFQSHLPTAPISSIASSRTHQALHVVVQLLPCRAHLERQNDGSTPTRAAHILDVTLDVFNNVLDLIEGRQPGDRQTFTAAHVEHSDDAEPDIAVDRGLCGDLVEGALAALDLSRLHVRPGCNIPQPNGPACLSG